MTLRENNRTRTPRKVATEPNAQPAEPTPVSIIHSDLRLYMPTYQEAQGRNQPLATALPFDAAKNLCYHHFMKQCRTIQYRVPRELRGDFSQIDRIHLRWNEQPAGFHEGRPENCPPAIGALAEATYQLHPAEKE